MNGKAQLIRADALMDEEGFSGIMAQISSSIYIEASSSGTGFFSGKIDEVRIKAQ